MTLRRLPFALRSLFVVVAVIASLAYAINAWQVFGFAAKVWRLPFVLCFGAAIVADALSLAGLFATYLLRSARWHVRAYSWFVFLLMTSLSIAAAESFARWRMLPTATKDTLAREPSLIVSDSAAGRVLSDASVAAAAIVVALTMSVHLLILSVRHAPAGPPAAERSPGHTGLTREHQPLLPLGILMRRRTKAADPPAFPQANEPAAPSPTPERPEAPSPAPAPPKEARKPAPRPSATSRNGRRNGVDRDDIAARVLAGQLTYEAAMAEGQVGTRRAVELWVKDYRERHPDVTVRRDLATPELGPTAEKPQINGRTPELKGVAS